MSRLDSPKNKNMNLKIKKVLYLHKKQLHNLKDTFLRLSKEMFASAIFSQYVLSDVTSHYFTLYGEVQSGTFELIITCSNTVAKVNDQIIGSLNSVDDLEILNCLLVIAASQMHIRILLYYFKDYFNHLAHNLLLDTLEDTVSLTKIILDEFSSIE